jgi:hypothetical protein
LKIELCGRDRATYPQRSSPSRDAISAACGVGAAYSAAFSENTEIFVPAVPEPALQRRCPWQVSISAVGSSTWIVE